VFVSCKHVRSINSRVMSKIRFDLFSICCVEKLSLCGQWSHAVRSRLTPWWSKGDGIEADAAAAIVDRSIGRSSASSR